MACGAALINDISGGKFEPEILVVAAASGAGLILGYRYGKLPPSIHDKIKPLMDRFNVPTRRVPNR